MAQIRDGITGEIIAADVDDDHDYERYGGPIVPGSILTLLNACLKPGWEHIIPSHVIDAEKVAREINSWLVLVADTTSDAANGVGQPRS